MRSAISNLILFSFCIVFLSASKCPKQQSPAWTRKAPSFYRKYLVEQLPTQGNRKIPKIIHQVWHVWNPAKPEIPANFIAYSQQLQHMHPDWKYIFWDDAKSEQLLREHYPWFLETYRSYDKPIKRADAIRYFILHHMGGVYIDMGFQPLRNLDPLFIGANVVVGEQDDVFSYSIANGFMATSAKHPLFEQAINNLIQRKNLFVLKATGPAFIKKQINSYQRKYNDKGVRILHKHYLFPYVWYDKENPKAVACRKNPLNCASIFPDSFMVNHWRGSWL